MKKEKKKSSSRCRWYWWDRHLCIQGGVIYEKIDEKLVEEKGGGQTVAKEESNQITIWSQPGIQGIMGLQEAVQYVQAGKTPVGYTDSDVPVLCQ